MRFLATEFDADGTATGVVETYLADSIAECVDKCVYTRQLSGGRAIVGPTGLVVYHSNSLWAITRDKNADTR